MYLNKFFPQKYKKVFTKQLSASTSSFVPGEKIAINDNFVITK